MSSYHEDDDFEIANSDEENQDVEAEEEEVEAPDSDGEEVEIKDADADEEEGEDVEVEDDEDVQEDDEDAVEDDEDAVDDDEDADADADALENDDEDMDEPKKTLEGSKASNTSKKAKAVIPRPQEYEDDDEEEEDDMDENYLQKFDTEINKNYIMNFHPETSVQNYEEIEALTVVLRNKNNLIIDDLHRTCPYLTKYEYARVLGQRAKQINSGAQPFVRVPENIIDGAVIAEMELREKRIPFIIRRPLPNGGSEFWNLKDLDVISF